ncbi:MAG: M20/M25/M40 family metallo-hydrolase [Woeseiaceae bacterium]
MKSTTFVALVVALSFSMLSVASAELDDNEQRLVEWIDAHAEEAISLLAETANISSGTMNFAGVREVGKVMQREFDALGLETEWINQDAVNRAGHLFARTDGDEGVKFLLIGHLDTVFEADDAFQAFKRDGNIGHGPGVEDMKAGNVAIVYAIKALQEAGLMDGIEVVVAYTGDEEMSGRPLAISKKDLIEAGKWADYSLGFESAIFDDGQDLATISRRGSSNWILRVEGTQAHSSGIFGERAGAGAIFEAARILNEFYEEVRGEEYLTFNAGNIQGGTTVDYDETTNRGTTFGKTNVIPRKAVVHGDIRTISPEQLQSAWMSMQAVVARSLPLTSATLELDEGYPAMAPTLGNKLLYEQLSRVNEALGRGPMGVVDPSRRGAADISFVAPYSDSLAGLGAMGKGGHTPDESVELDSLALATKRAALLMYRLSRDAAETR